MVLQTTKVPSRAGSYKRTPEHRLLMRWCKIGYKSPNWKGGQHYYRGYVFIYQPNHPDAHKGYIKRAILVLEKKLGRALLPGMDCHHINGIRDDDAPENLTEFLHKEHAILNLNRMGGVRK